VQGLIDVDADERDRAGQLYKKQIFLHNAICSKKLGLLSGLNRVTKNPSGFA
jgi:hypothetical protein